MDADRIEPGSLREAQVGATADAASTAANWPAISYGCSVYGFQQAQPSRIREVAPAISSSAATGGW
ncbi:MULTISPECIES: hypothetical protein [unclassified Microbacterium]|uniref:hypothetical protein n=1 Tax=unclassified Microbacterium TaxID=2609290 RepID=UPI00214ABD3A|nr:MULTISPECIES: hypothetical protein [unclassified Microbacterium]MCR2810815.1 hypothetical protein [Microbacterium sp. zg.B185]WIM19778.1 hypothetical protein QNO12_02940 [Microbacterium sp. zg-B185]